MKRRVKAGHLREPGSPLGDGADRQQVVGLVQWRQRDERLELGEDGRVNSDRRGVVRPAVDDAVSDRSERRIARMTLQPLEQEFERAGMVRRRVFAPFVLSYHS